MSPDLSGRLVILSGPSCVGKSPLFKALGKFYPELHRQFHKLVLVNSRAPRPGERDGVDYHFRTRAQVDALRVDDRYAVMEVRSDLQALDIQELEALLRRGDVFFEGNSFVGRALQTHPRLANVNRLSIFISPLSKREIVYLKAPEHNLSLPEFVTDVMRRKLLRRTRRQKGELSAPDLENIETRASSAYRELQEAWHFQHVIPNHDGEDSDHWEAFYYLIGDGRKTLEAFAALLRGSVPSGVETWEENLLPPTREN
jgi:guanylate kinase